jgi:hypothetical protein
MSFLATSHTKNTISEKTLKHTIQLIYPKKRYEHTLFLKVIIIAFTHKNNKNNKSRSLTKTLKLKERDALSDLLSRGLTVKSFTRIST